MSAASSIPIDKRIRSSPMPASASAAASNCAWVVEAGWITSVLASPTLARWLANVRLSINRAAASRPPRNPECDNRAGPARHEPSGEIGVGMVGERGMAHPRDRLICAERGEDRQGIADMPVHSGSERFDARQNGGGARRRQRRAKVAQSLDAGPRDEGGGSIILDEVEAMVAIVRLDQGLVPPRPAPIEAPGVNRGRRRGPARGRRSTSSANA